MREQDASLTRQYKPTEKINIDSRNLTGIEVNVMVDVLRWTQRATAAKCQAAGPHPGDPDYELLSSKADYKDRASAWSAAMEIESNPHAAAL